jgi:hypothetical protein
VPLRLADQAVTRTSRWNLNDLRLHYQITMRHDLGGMCYDDLEHPLQRGVDSELSTTPAAAAARSAGDGLACPSRLWRRVKQWQWEDLAVQCSFLFNWQ